MHRRGVPTPDGSRRSGWRGVGGQAGIAAAQVFYFADKALFKHQVETQGDVFVQSGAVFGNQGGGVEFEGQGVFGLSVQVRAHLPAGQVIDFKGASDALAVVRFQTACCFRVDFCRVR